MSQMVERIAAIIDDGTEAPYGVCVGLALEILEAMREPTKAMVQSGNCRPYAEHLNEETADQNTELTWEAMIAQALKE